MYKCGRRFVACFRCVRAQHLTGVVLVLLLVCSCGFHLRGQSPASAQESLAGLRFALQADELYAELPRLLRDAMLHAGMASSEQAADVYLDVVSEKLTRRTQSVDEFGRPADYELIYSVSYRLHSRDVAETDAPIRQISTRRDYAFDNRDLLGKAEEENVLVSEMRKELVDRVLRQVRYQLAAGTH